MNKLKEYLKLYDIELNDVQVQQFDTYYNMLIKKNEVMNLTAITDKDEVILKHFVDSIAVAKFFNFNDKISLIDVGTGAGFPGIPLKIVFPNIEVVLFDSLNKRLKFLDEVIDELGLTNITTVHGRAEDGGRDIKLRQKFDVVVSRAVANMAVLSEYCIPFVKVGGVFISYKSGQSEEEINVGKKAIKVLGAKIQKIKSLELPDSDISRSFVFIKKFKDTPKAYPRRAGIISKEPIK